MTVTTVAVVSQRPPTWPTYAGPMRRAVFAIIPLLALGGCQVPAEAPAPPAAEPSSTDSSDTGASDEPDAAQPAVSFCDEFDPSTLDWFELGLGDPSTISTERGIELQVQRGDLPPSSAERYNTLVEVCPGFHLATTFDGQTALIALDEDRYAPTSALTPAGELGSVEAPGVVAGGPTWGFRDSVIAGDWLYLSDGIVDTARQCVSVGVHRVDVESVLTGQSTSTDVIYRSEPCVSYTDDYRAQAPLKVHLGGALAYRASIDELYVSIGDLHMGASRISQAEAVGIDNLERDYAMLGDPEAAVSAVVAIAGPSTAPAARIIAKGLRNSLGMTIVATDRLWLTDHGPQGGDELNLIEEGSDYGWPLTSTGAPYDRSSYGDPASLPAPWLDIENADIPGTTAPARDWSPAIAPTAIVQYPESARGIEGWAGDLVIASLRAQSLVHLSLTVQATIEEDRLQLGERLRDMVVTDDGRLVAVTDSSRLVVVGS